MSTESIALEHPSSIDPNKVKVVPLRHPWRWAAALLVAIAIIMMVRSAISNPEFQWPVVANYIFNPMIMRGLAQTIVITILVMILAVIGGTVAALMMLSPSKLLSVPAAVFVWLFRGTPALVQLMLWYNLSLVVKEFSLWLPGYGTVFSIATNDIMTPFVSAVVALSLHEAGYMAEIVRGGLKSVSQGQSEAAACLGMKPSLSLRRIVLPQAMRMIIPPTGNETINLLKTTSLVSIIAVSDLLYSAQAIYARTFETIPLLIVVTFWYLVVVSVMSIGQYHLERHFSRDERGHEPGLLSAVFGKLFRFRRKEVMA
ncbi:amino acid ABC transporter permease [Rhizobium leguminosarum]|uniref:Glutamate/aspartate import permease protein GltK n=1 Tax=Rhizobium leguminosarum TaxID=384 RepID=A0A2K9ZCS8_RHILE|nr:amino acid ABC transporter permease [Rhizobium leguminosarum]AUW46055.1 Amino acid ABC transporter permease protein [Rhizobium leguminosarum]NKL44041.1 ABC transporter permease subunit [Rhizobium leguminosarum bv. viciae]TBZ79185.1 amino acid ABC transporter permease [Rhizobium leguminosarum bv. viciae]UIJ82183.1 amino acid ABC transporter permease [Rhizobium leguminosarum]UIY26726.1 amino acid ABC transporter permease [Rhizobium leguminosarum]